MKPGGTIFIGYQHHQSGDGRGAATLELALTVVTNSPEIAAVLVKKPLYDVVMLGGEVQRASGAALGPRRWIRCRGCYSTRGFIGGCAMAPESGLTGFDYADYEFKKAVIKQCSEIIISLTSG